MAMKKFGTIIFAAIIGASSIFPVAADAAERLPGETALEMANRINACNGAGVLGAQFTDGGSLLEVTCRGGAALSGGLGTAGAVALGVVVVAVIAAAASGGGSSSTTSTGGGT